MKRFLWLLSVAAFAVVASAEEVGQIYSGSVSVTQANSAVVFTDNGSGGTGQMFRAIAILVRASGANTCYLDIKDTVATTADIPLAPGESVTFSFPGTSQPADGWPGIGAICSTGQTATFLVTAMR